MAREGNTTSHYFDCGSTFLDELFHVSVAGYLTFSGSGLAWLSTLEVPFIEPDVSVAGNLTFSGSG